MYSDVKNRLWTYKCSLTYLGFFVIADPSTLRGFLCPSDQISCDNLSVCGLNWSAPGIRSTWETPGTEIGDSFYTILPWILFLIARMKEWILFLMVCVLSGKNPWKEYKPYSQLLKCQCALEVSPFSLYMSVCFVCWKKNLPFHRRKSICFIIALTFEGLCTF